MAGHVDGHPGRQVAGVVGQSRPLALAAHAQPGGGLDLHLDVAVEGQGQGVESGAQIGRRRRGPGTHARQNRRWVTDGAGSPAVVRTRAANRWLPSEYVT